MRIKPKDMRPTRKPASARAVQKDRGEICRGTVGWDDGKSHFNLDPEGVPFVKVTLFKGHNPVTEGENKTPELARGHKVVMTIDPAVHPIPDAGTHVVVARVAGETYYVLLTQVKRDPKWIPNRKSGEQVFFGPNDSFYRIKEDGTHYLFAKAGDGEDAKPVFVKIGRDGFEVRHPHGRMRADKLGFEMAHSSGAAVAGGALSGLPPPLDVLSSFLSLKAAMVNVEAAAVKLGTGPSDNVMKSIPTLATLTAIQATFDALATYLTALHGIAGTVAVSGVNAPIATLMATPFGAWNVARSASGAAVAAAATTAPTTTTSVG